MSRRGASIVAEPGRWLTRLARRIHLRGAGRGALPRETVADWILCDPTFILAVKRYHLHVAVWLSAEAPPMQPAARAPATWPLPTITTSGQLAAWLGVPMNELEWFAGWCGRRKTAADGRLSHYRYRAVRKRHGEVRLLEVPKPRLRDLQRQVLRRLLDLIPPHEAAHGFHGGRSARSFAAPHAGRRVVLRLDLADFFPTIHFHLQVAAIALEEGFTVNARKTRIMRAGVRQHLAGIVVNQHPNLARHDYDRLKALLHNCVVHGPHTQNHQNHADFRAHLAGKIGYVEMLNPSRARRLRELFNRIDW